MDATTVGAATPTAVEDDDDSLTGVVLAPEITGATATAGDGIGAASDCAAATIDAGLGVAFWPNAFSYLYVSDTQQNKK